MNFIKRVQLCYLILIGKKVVVGRFLTVRIKGNSNKIIKTNAKIDTGAFSVSIGTKLLPKLGMDEVVDLLNSTKFSEFKNKYKSDDRDINVDDSDVAELIKNYPIVKSIGRVYSSNGYEFRPFIELKIKTNTQYIDTTVNVSSRKNLRNHIILGRQFLNNYVIDVTLDKEKAIKTYE